MLLYSETTKTFIIKIRSLVKEIIINEMHLTMDKSRIRIKNTFYPLSIVVFEDQQKLGYFDSRFFELGISKKLMYQANTRVLKNIIRHELAHFISFVEHGPQVMHGEEFKIICRRYLWDDEVERAYINVELQNEEMHGDLQSEKLLAKIKKLLALASSENSHEAELATLRANALLLEHNLSFLNAQKTNAADYNVYVERVIEGSRKNSKHMAIYEILKTFHVSPIFNQGRGAFYLEVIGEKTNVELAVYVASYLDSMLEIMWSETKKQNKDLSSVSAKNAYFKGVATGYCQKVKLQNQTLASSTDLMVLENKLSTNLKMVYSRIGHTKSTAGRDHQKANEMGIESGRNLSIRPGIKNKSAGNILLDFFKK